MDLSFSEYTPIKSIAPSKPSPPLYAGSYVEPSEQYFVCTLCGEQHPVHPACPDCGKVHE